MRLIVKKPFHAPDGDGEIVKYKVGDAIDIEASWTGRLKEAGWLEEDANAAKTAKVDDDENSSASEAAFVEMLTAAVRVVLSEMFEAENTATASEDKAKPPADSAGEGKADAAAKTTPAKTPTTRAKK